jgi:hypothetical protein
MDSQRMRPLSQRTPRLTEHSVTDDLELLIAAMAREVAHRHQCSLAAATRQIRDLVAEAREEYRAVGSPYGEDDQGFCRLPPRASAPDTYRMRRGYWFIQA